MTENKIQINAIVLGDSAVGKSSILKAMSTKEAVKENEVSATIGGVFVKIMREYEGKEVEIKVTDTSGEERFRSIAKGFYRKAKFAILVFDITNRQSFESLQFWVDEAIENGQEIKFVLVGNKIDLRTEESISIEETNAFAQKIGSIACLTSALTFDGIDDLSDRIVDLFMKKEAQEEKEEKIEKNESLQITDLAVQQPQSTGCC